MSLAQDVPALVDAMNEAKAYLGYNATLLDIYEGNLKPYIESDLLADFKPESAAQILTRVAPVNLLTQVVGKLSKIYTQPPARSFAKENTSDSELLKFYEDSMKLNRVMNQGNEFFNLFKSCLLQPYANNGKPKIRAIPSSLFKVFSDDVTDPTRVTKVVVKAGTYKDADGSPVDRYFAYTDEEMLIFDGKGRILVDEMTKREMDGTNAFKRIPFVYVNRSLNCLTPTQDSDVLAMVKLLPIILSDLGYAIKFQAFSIMYGIDVDEQNLTMSPNAFWRMKSDPKSENKPEIGTIKPTVDITEVQGYIQFLLGIWLQSKNIRPGAVGDGSENFSSGISKMVDEMDTSEDRRKQVEFFKPAEEEDLWPLIIEHMHPVWVQTKQLENTAMFTPGAKVMVNFAEQLPMVRRGEMVKDLDLECKAGFLTRKDAIAKLNPQWSEKTVEEYAAEVQAEIDARAPDVAPDGKNPGEDPFPPKKEDAGAA